MFPNSACHIAGDTTVVEIVQMTLQVKSIAVAGLMAVLTTVVVVGHRVPEVCRCLTSIDDVELSAACRWCGDVIRRDADVTDDQTGSSYTTETVGWISPCEERLNISAIACQDGAFESFPVLPDVERPIVFVDLKRNAIRRLDDVTTASWQRSGVVVGHLRLSENRLSTILESVAGRRRWRRNLVTFDLSYNELTWIDHVTFAGFSRLVRLDLSHNLVERVSGSAFTGLTSLTTLDMGSNRLTVLGDRMFRGLSSLGYLLVDSNRIARIEPDSLKHLDRLVYLVLRDNPLETLQQQQLEV